MTGPEHYREAERLLRGWEEPETIAAAQVHATLALAAATALASNGRTPTGTAEAEWLRAILPANTKAGAA